MNVLEFINILSAGLLAGEEFANRYGARGPVVSLLRQALIRTLRVLVPAVFTMALSSEWRTLIERWERLDTSRT